jgi:CDP-diacylglycerol---glycerol-3-phosphate 3-phosphatidyltransferase
VPLNLPNAISVARLLLAFPLGVLLWMGGQGPYSAVDALALGVFAFIFVTDLVDGWLARRMNQVTDLGKLLDPLADKVVIALTMVFLVERGLVPAWGVALILVRELAVSGLRGGASQRGVFIAASSLAKAKTLLQSLAALVLLMPPEVGVGTVTAGPVGLGLFYAAVLVTVLTGLDYFRRFDLG